MANDAVGEGIGAVTGVMKITEVIPLVIFAK